MFYGFRVDKALLDIGIDANQISIDFRRDMKTFGKASSLSPQEVAVLIAALTPLSQRPGLRTQKLRDWLRSERVDVEADQVRAAMHELGIFDLS